MLTITVLDQPQSYIFNRLVKGETDDLGNVTYQGIPANNKFYDTRYELVPYNFNGNLFKITTDTIDRKIQIAVTIKSPDLQISPVRNTSVYLSAYQQVVALNLAEGLNYIYIQDPVEGDSAFVIANARRFASFLWAYATELYINSESLVDEMTTAIYSPFATRIVEPLFTNLYPYLPLEKSVQRTSLRLLTKSFTWEPSRQGGVIDTAQAFTLNHAFLATLDKTSTEVDPIRFPFQSWQEFFAGQIAHLWIPNYAILRWATFIQYCANIQNFSVLSISENEVVIQDNSGNSEGHVFDFQDEPNYFANNPYYIAIFGTSDIVNSNINLIAPGYTFDLVVDQEHLLGRERLYFDEGIPFDSGYAFDGDALDPDSDGYLGLSLIDRNEREALYGGNTSYDTTQAPDLIPGPIGIESYYKGYYNKCVDIVNDAQATDATTPGSITVSPLGVVSQTSLDGGTFINPIAVEDFGSFDTPENDFDGGSF